MEKMNIEKELKGILEKQELVNEILKEKDTNGDITKDESLYILDILKEIKKTLKGIYKESNYTNSNIYKKICKVDKEIDKYKLIARFAN